MQNEPSIPGPNTFSSAPVRNRICVELAAPVSEVWALVGDISRLPEYSAGLERVDVTRGANGSPKDYVCHFKPPEPGLSGAVARDHVRWHEPNRGWASAAEEPNDLGLKNSVHVVTLDSSGQGTLLKWHACYDADDVDMTRSELDKALADIAERLAKRFGGRILERFVQGAQ